MVAGEAPGYSRGDTMEAGFCEVVKVPIKQSSVTIDPVSLSVDEALTKAKFGPFQVRVLPIELA